MSDVETTKINAQTEVVATKGLAYIWPLILVLLLLVFFLEGFYLLGLTAKALFY